MAKRSPFPFTACIDHAHYSCREVVTLSATCNFKSEKSLEERKANFFSIRERCPDGIPVIVQKADTSRIPYAKIRFHIQADSNLVDLFVAIWNQIFKHVGKEKKQLLFMLLKHKDLVFKKLVQSVYDDYKDEDGNLCITLRGEIRDILPHPSPCNISAKTFFAPPNMPSGFKPYHELKDGCIDLDGQFYECIFNKEMKVDWFRELECDKCPCPRKLIFYLAATGIENKKENIKKFREHIKQFRKSGQMERMDMDMISFSAAPDINNGESRSKYVSDEYYFLAALILFILSVNLIFM